MFEKQKRYENKAYVEYIKQQSCCVTSMMIVNQDSGKIESDPHHTTSKGAGGSDLSCVPLLHELHQECHTIGKETFQKKYNVNFELIQLALIKKWIERVA
ncbi:DUF968 domain-containing protein [Candidatus Pacearchaeota archaeon]|nr:DUF968 domain-containing protein [Candidatus Pacearchaeota archaeon]